jgi:thiol:disulfide interchange protein DsbD
MVLAALFVLIAMNLMGNFEVSQWAPQGLASMQPKNPVVSAFLAGVLAVAVASPCSAPFMGAALGLALTVPAWQGLLIFASLGLGLALPFLLLGFLPKLAAWLPKPGAWMDTFKRFLAFPMLATAVWLVWVLGQQNGIDAAASLLILLLALALVVWVFDGWSRHRKAQTKTTPHDVAAVLAFLVAVLAILYFGPIALKPSPALTAESATTSPQAPSASTSWQIWSPARQAQALAAGQSVFVDYTAAWCVTCQFNKQTTLNQPEVMAAFQAKKVVLLRADWTRPDPVIAQSITQLGRSAVPVYVLQAPGQAPNVLPELLSPAIVQQALARLP